MRIQFYHPKQNETTVVEIKNFEFLPLFYLIPIDLLRRECPGLADMPRSAHGIFKQPEWAERITSDLFLQAVGDLTAYFVWPSFGISTYMECFSGDDSLWRLAHATGIWEAAFEQMSGMTPQNIVRAIKREWEPPELEEFQELMVNIGLRGIRDFNLMPTIQTLREIRCIEDYDARSSHAKIDFYRKWYHTRTRFKTVSLDQLIDGQRAGSRCDAVDALLSNFVGDPTSDFEDAICSNMDAEKFYEKLTSRDREILKMRVKGATYQEIADDLGYQTHSAVLKRINRIAEQYLDYADEQEETRTFLKG